MMNRWSQIEQNESPECVDLPRKSHSIYDDICDPVAFGKKTPEGKLIKNRYVMTKQTHQKSLFNLGCKGALVW